MESDSRSGWALGWSFVEILLLLVFAAMLMSVTDQVEGGGALPQPRSDEPQHVDLDLQARLDRATETGRQLEQQLNEQSLLLSELRLMVGAKVSTKESFQEAIETLKRGYALCQRDGNTLIEASVQHGEESIQVIGEIPSDLNLNVAKGDQLSDLDEIVSFMQDVYQYEKDHGCRFNYRLKYATDNDYRKAREGFEKYFFPEKMIRAG